MTKLIFLAALIISALTLPAQAQIRANGEQEVLMSARNGKVDLVTPGTPSFLIPIVADPPANKQDTFDIVSDNNTAIITLILPNGIEINASNAVSLGYSYATATFSSGSSIPIFTSGTHTLIALPIGAPAGTYQVKINTLNTTTDTLVAVSHYSSSLLRVALLTDAATYRLNDLVILSGIVYDGTTAVTGANVTALIGDQNNPSAAPIQVVLQNSGELDDNPNDGIYTGTFTASSAGIFIASMRVNGTSALGVAYSRMASTSFKVIGPRATLGSFSDTAIDDNANGRPDRIVVTPTINVQTAGKYFFYVQLFAGNGAKLLAKTRSTLQVGARQMEVSFDIDELRSLNASGPYTLKNATLIYEDDLDMPVYDGKTLEFKVNDNGNTLEATLTKVTDNEFVGDWKSPVTPPWKSSKSYFWGKIILTR